MKLHSDILTKSDIYEAAKVAGVHVWTCDQFKARVRSTGWTIHLSGSSSYRSQATDQPAATWDEHGIWMAELYKRDPQLRVAFYKTLGEFIAHTTNARDSWHNQNQPESKRVSAPWLNDPKLRLEYLRGELRAERISYGELAELQGLVKHIDAGDVELLEAAGVPEFA